MPYLIDGHNLIPKVRGLSLADPDDEHKLVLLLRAYLARARKKGTVVFDQGAPGGGRGWSNSVLTVRFARARKADDVIAELLRRESNPRGLTVVSGDAEVARAARQAGARVQPPAEFARALEQATRPASAKSAAKKLEGGLSPEEVAAWEREFRKKR